MISTILKGCAMGIAEVIPGVSGGTIAFVTGIYTQLIHSISCIDFTLLKQLGKGEFNAIWEHVNGHFLIQLMLGMIFGFGIGLYSLSYLLENFPVLVWSFFFGLILASSIYVFLKIERHTVVQILSLIAGGVFAYLVTQLTPTAGNSTYGYLFLSGLIAVSALLLPGLSGSFMLLIMGMYEFVMHKIIKEGIIENFSTVAIGQFIVFACGGICSLLFFSKFLNWLFEHYKNLTFSVLTGFMIGSLNKVWPWQQVMESRIDSNGERAATITKNILPETFSRLTDNLNFGSDPMVLYCILSLLLGIGVVALLSFVESKNS